MQITHSYINAHRQITPHSTRANTEPSGSIDAAMMGIISAKSPQSHRVQKLLKMKAVPLKKKSSKAEAELFERVYDR